MDNEAISNINEQLKKSADNNQYITFSIDDEEFAIEILKVQEIISYTQPTHVPNVSEYVVGVINLRGVIIPIIDLRKKFEMQEKQYDKFTVIVVVEICSKTMGLIVDAVSDVLVLDENNLQDVPEISEVKSAYMKCIGKIGERLIIVLDIDKLLGHQENEQSKAEEA